MSKQIYRIFVLVDRATNQSMINGTLGVSNMISKSCWNDPYLGTLIFMKTLTWPVPSLFRFMPSLYHLTSPIFRTFLRLTKRGNHYVLFLAVNRFQAAETAKQCSYQICFALILFCSPNIDQFPRSSDVHVFPREKLYKDVLRRVNWSLLIIHLLRSTLHIYENRFFIIDQTTRYLPTVCTHILETIFLSEWWPWRSHGWLKGNIQPESYYICETAIYWRLNTENESTIFLHITITTTACRYGKS